MADKDNFSQESDSCICEVNNNVTNLRIKGHKSYQGDSSCQPQVMLKASPWLKRLSSLIQPRSVLVVGRLLIFKYPSFQSIEFNFLFFLFSF